MIGYVRSLREVAPLWGFIVTPAHARTLRLRIAHSTNRLTRKWSRRFWWSVRSWRRGARLICNVIPTEKAKNFRSHCFGVLVASWCSSWHCATSRGRRNSRGGAHSDVLISGVATERRRSASAAAVGVVRSRRRQTSRQRGLANSGAASLPNWWTLRPALVRRAGQPEHHRSFRPSDRASSFRDVSSRRRRAALRVIRRAIVLADVLSGAGSFERRYNIRLHQTAPREPCSHPGHGQPPLS